MMNDLKCMISDFTNLIPMPSKTLKSSEQNKKQK